MVAWAYLELTDAGLFTMGDPQRGNQEKYIRKTNIWAPNQNEIEMSVQRYLAKESRTPELCTRL